MDVSPRIAGAPFAESIEVAVVARPCSSTINAGEGLEMACRPSVAQSTDSGQDDERFGLSRLHCPREEAEGESRGKAERTKLVAASSGQSSAIAAIA